MNIIIQPGYLCILSLLCGSLLFGCASSPFNLEGVNRTLQPQQTLNDNKTLNARVIWGGLIVATRNLKGQTQIEVLGYPVDAYGEPQRQATAQGRFLLTISGFLEPAQYASGRWISAIGSVQPSATGKIGDAEYLYPVLQVEQHHLWPEQQESESDIKTRFHFGIGIRL